MPYSKQDSAISFKAKKGVQKTSMALNESFGPLPGTEIDPSSKNYDSPVKQLPLPNNEKHGDGTLLRGHRSKL
jgi:hypothetical protein